MKNADIEKIVAKKLDIPLETVNKVMKCIYKAYIDKLSSVPVDDRSIHPNDFNKMKTSCSIYSVGSLVIKGSTIYGRREKEKKIKLKNERNNVEHKEN